MRIFRGIAGILMIPFCFLTEYFLVALWLHVITVNPWWIVYFILADLGNGYFAHKLLKA